MRKFWQIGKTEKSAKHLQRLAAILKYIGHVMPQIKKERMLLLSIFLKIHIHFLKNTHHTISSVISVYVMENEGRMHKVSIPRRTSI